MRCAYQKVEIEMTAPSIGLTRRYWLQKLLGKGGMGEVYIALDRLTGTNVALKRVLHAPQELLFSPRLQLRDSTYTETDLRRVLASEFRILASLRHPHIISVLDYGFDEANFPYYTMVLLEEAKTVLEAAQSLNLEGRIQLFAAILQALAYLHRRSILHGDLKPSNILVDKHNAIKLLDFGLATHEHRQNSSGTLAYTPPELLRREPATLQSDLYSLGIVAYQVFAGRYPFNGETVHQLIDQILREMPDMDVLPESVRLIIFRMLMKDPTDRYPDVEMALADLSDFKTSMIVIEDEAMRESFLQAARFVGRDHELNLMTRQLDQIIKNAQSEFPNAGGGRELGSAFLIGGESGTGKSRLLEELRIHALLHGALVLRGQCVAETGTPFQMWRDVIRRLLIETDVSDLEAGILGEIIPDISILLDRPISPVPALDVNSARNRLVETIVGVFQRQTQPIVLILEDLHWGAESLIPLRRILKVYQPLPILIVGSYRSDEMAVLPNQLPEMRPLMLARFTPKEIAELTRAMIGGVAEQSDIVEYLNTQSGGNALFLIEVLRALAEEAGNLGSIPQITLPDQVVTGGIDRIIRRRVTRLPADAVPVLQLAALAGRDLDYKLLKALVGDVIDPYLQAGMDAAILEVAGDQWRFAHDRLRDAIIGMIPSHELPSLHQRIAEGLETLYPRHDNLANALYGHWGAAQNVEKQAYYGIIVIQQRLHLGILNEAFLMLEQVISIKPKDLYIQTQLYLLAGNIYFHLGNSQKSTESYATSLQLARQIDLPNIAGRALEGLGNAIYLLSEFESALRWYNESLELRRSINDQQGVASVLHFISVLYRFQGKYADSWQALEESIAIRRMITDQRGLGDSLYQMSIHARYRGEYPQAIGYLQDAVRHHQLIGDLRGLGDDLNNLGICYTLIGEYQQALEALRDSVTHRQAADGQRAIASCYNSFAELGLVQRQWDIGIRNFENALGIWYSVQDRWNIANSHAGLGYAQACAHEFISAKYHLYAGLEIATKISAYFIVCKALIGWALIELQEQKDHQAAVLLGAVEQHPAMTAQLHQLYFDPVISMIDMDIYAEAYNFGKSMELQSIVKMLLIEAKPN